MSTDKAHWSDHLPLAAFYASAIAVIPWLLSPTSGWDAKLVAIAIAASPATFIRKYQRKPPAERFASPNDRAAHCERMREVLQNRLYDQRTEKLRSDIIIKDIARQSEYPYGGASEKGISAWFRLGLVGIYHRGIVVAHAHGYLKEEAYGYRYRDWINEEEGDVRVMQVSNIPFDSIASVNIGGDEFYGYPHILCHFDFEGEPYEITWFAEELESSPGTTYLHQVATQADVARNNPVDGTLTFG
jgi:hypothetical protein